MYPNSEEAPNWSSDDRETFRCYRQDIADTFMYCYNILNLELLDILSTKLSEALQKCNGTDANNYWNEIETCLHAFSAVAESIEWENLYLPKLMDVLKEIPYGQLHTKVLTSALETVGEQKLTRDDSKHFLNSILARFLLGVDYRTSGHHVFGHTARNLRPR